MPTTPKLNESVDGGSQHPLVSRSSVRRKTAYCLRVRIDDSEDWSAPEYYETRKERDQVAATNRILGGIRTHSFEEKKTTDELSEIFG